jgi:hypothetical protein
MNSERTAKTIGVDKAMSSQIARLEKAFKARQSGKVVQLPLWPEPSRGTPNSVLRGALFAAIDGKRGRKAMQRQLLASQKGIEIRFTGLQLDQGDMDVFEQALHIVRQNPLGDRCEFSAHGFLKAMGKTTGKCNHEALKNAFARLMGCGVEITHDRFTYGGSLLEFYRDEHTERYVVVFNPKIIALYDAGWTAIDWEQRRTLQRKPLALWLHGYLATHARPHPVKIETLMQMSGSGTKTF